MRITSLTLIVVLFLSSFGYVFAGTAPEYDLVIMNGRIIDGTGNPWFTGSVAVNDGRIVRVGWFDPSNAKQVIDAKRRSRTYGKRL